MALEEPRLLSLYGLSSKCSAALHQVPASSSAFQATGVWMLRILFHMRRSVSADFR